MVRRQLRQQSTALIKCFPRYDYNRKTGIEALEKRNLLAISATWLAGTSMLDIQGTNETVGDPAPTPEVEDFKVTAEQVGGTGPYFVKIFENDGSGTYDVLIPIQNSPPGGLMASGVVKMLIET
jgi:hypothetical protein